MAAHVSPQLNTKLVRQVIPDTASIVERWQRCYHDYLGSWSTVIGTASATTCHKPAILLWPLSAGRYDAQANLVHSPAVLDVPGYLGDIGPVQRLTTQQLSTA